MTPQEQPDSQDRADELANLIKSELGDSQAGDEQTETDELKRIITDAMSKVYGYESYSDLCRYDADTNVWSIASNIVREADAAVVTLEAWSRQQTAQVLDKLLEQKTTYMDGGSWEAVPLSAIAALRVGLEGKQ